VGSGEDEDVAALVAAAGCGDPAAWEALVGRYAGLVWGVARAFGLDAADAADVSQTTWLRLLENIDRLSEPGRVGSWLATTARRECLRVLAKGKRTSPVGDDAVFEFVSLRSQEDEAVDGDIIAAERAAAVRTAVAALPESSQDMLRLMMMDPAPSYEEMAEKLGRPVGSLGPSRRRTLEKLRGMLAEADMELLCA
jgi:RNA polymerase sigma factor (sigma-70 family)